MSSDDGSNVVDDGGVHETHGRTVSRRALLGGGVATAGAAWVAPVVVDSLISVAAAATDDFPWDSSTKGGPKSTAYSVGVPANRAVNFTVVGGGGGGGQAGHGSPGNDGDGGVGGNGTQLTGTIPAQGSGYTLYIAVGGGGGGGHGATGGKAGGISPYGTGGKGGDRANSWGGRRRGRRWCVRNLE